MNPAWSRARPLFLWAQQPNLPESQKLTHINQAEPRDSCITKHTTNKTLLFNQQILFLANYVVFTTIITNSFNKHSQAN